MSNRQLNSIWIRIEQCIKDINNSRIGGLGVQFYRYIVAMLNAFIVVALEDESEIDFRNALSFENGKNKVFLKNLEILKKNRQKYEGIYTLVNLDFWKIFKILCIEEGFSLEIFSSLNKIPATNSIQEQIEKYVYSLAPVTIERYESLKNGDIEDIEFEKLRKSISSKIINEKIDNKKQVAILSHLKKMYSDK